MKLKTPLTNSQRDSRWNNVLLGYNTLQTYSIGNYGCLITSLGNYVGKNPDEVNTILKNNNGFVSGGSFVWSASKFLGINETFSSPTYNDAVPDTALTTMRGYLDKGFPLVSEIDFNPNTVSEEMHYILITGYDGDKFYAIDSWTGTEIDMSVYGGIKRALLKYRVYDKTLAMVSENVAVNTLIVEQSAEFIKLQNCEYASGVFYKAQDIIKYIADRIKERDLARTDSDEKSKTINSLNATIETDNSQIKTLSTDNSSLTSRVTTLTEDVDRLTEQAKQIPELLQQVGELENEKKLWDGKFKEMNIEIEKLKKAIPKSSMTKKIYNILMYFDNKL